MGRQSSAKVVRSHPRGQLAPRFEARPAQQHRQPPGGNEPAGPEALEQVVELGDGPRNVAPQPA